ncbi:MAG: T9SS type A sorting domain-containing protein [Caldithrix sp.]|nr:T9SS type A sorting domain-containing protein [Caldithrix sp.]
MYRIALLIIILLSGLVTTIRADDDLRSKIGQMIMVGFYGTDIPDSLRYDIQHRNLGGVVTLAYNLEDPTQIRQLTDSLQSLAQTPLFLAVDQEGGYVARLDEQNGFEETYTAYELGTVYNFQDSTREQAARMAAWLRNTGLNVNLAPVVDVNVNPQSPAIGNHERSFSDNPFAVTNHASWFIDEFHQKNIITTLKHFPGHGSAEDDSHNGFTDITDTWSDQELIPYENLLATGYADIIMTGHLFNADIDEAYPATLSNNAINGLLRDSLGHDGVVISDAMYMRAIQDNYDFDEAIELAVNAGVDILLYTAHMRAERSLTGMIIDIVENKVHQGLIAESTIDAAYQRIADLKDRYLTGQPIAARRDILPQNYTLSAYPNPFNSRTQIQFQLARSGYAELKLYNVRGQYVQTINEGRLNRGKHQISFDGSHLASGVYFVRLQTDQQTVTYKLTLMK